MWNPNFPELRCTLLGVNIVDVKVVREDRGLASDQCLACRIDPLKLSVHGHDSEEVWRRIENGNESVILFFQTFADVDIGGCPIPTLDSAISVDHRDGMAMKPLYSPLTFRIRSSAS